MKELIITTWNKAKDMFKQQRIEAIKNQYEDIETFERVHSGFIVTVELCKYFIYDKSLAEILRMDLTEFVNYAESLDFAETIEMLEEHWQEEQSEELFLQRLSYAVISSVDACLMSEDSKKLLSEYSEGFKAHFMQYKEGLEDIAPEDVNTTDLDQLLTVEDQIENFDVVFFARPA